MIGINYSFSSFERIIAVVYRPETTPNNFVKVGEGKRANQNDVKLIRRLHPISSSNYPLPLNPPVNSSLPDNSIRDNAVTNQYVNDVH